MDHNKQYLKYIINKAFRNYSHLLSYIASKNLFQKTLYYNHIKKGIKINILYNWGKLKC